MIGRKRLTSASTEWEWVEESREGGEKKRGGSMVESPQNSHPACLEW